jgi:hypothetical protein
MLAALALGPAPLCLAPLSSSSDRLVCSLHLPRLFFLARAAFLAAVAASFSSFSFSPLRRLASSALVSRLRIYDTQSCQCMNKYALICLRHVHVSSASPTLMPSTQSSPQPSADPSAKPSSRPTAVPTTVSPPGTAMLGRARQTPLMSTPLNCHHPVQTKTMMDAIYHEEDDKAEKLLEQGASPTYSNLDCEEYGFPSSLVVGCLLMWIRARCNGRSSATMQAWRRRLRTAPSKLSAQGRCSGRTAV